MHLKGKIIELPSNFTNSSMFNFFSKFIDEETLDPLYNKIYFQLDTLKFIKPTGVTAFANTCELLLSRGCNVSFSYDPNMTYSKKCPICYLDDSGFFETYSNHKIHKYSSCRATTLPLKKIHNNEWFAWVENTVVPWIDSKLNCNIKDQFPELKTCFWEICNNIIDHSGENIANSFIQYYPHDSGGRIEIAISDFGVGIPYNVAKACSFETHAEAIEIAIRDGFSTKSSHTNRGAGLGILIDNVVLNNQGIVQIFSYRGEASFLYNKGKKRHIARNIFFYPGTLIKITINTDTILQAKDNNSEKFEW